MNLQQIKGDLLNPTAQIITFDATGKLLSSCNSLFSLKQEKTESLFDKFPILEGLQEPILSIKEGDELKFPCMWFQYDAVSGYFDFLITKKGTTFIWLLQDFDRIYKNFIKVQQERNESIINSEILEIHLKTKEKLRKAERAYEYLFNNTPDLIQSIDLSGNFIFTNPAWRKALNYTEEELSKLNLFDIVYPEDVQKFKQLIDNLNIEKKLKFVELRLLSKTGNLIYVRGTINAFFNDGVLVSKQGIYRNITERKLVEDKLKQSETLYRLLVENASDIIIKTDIYWKITYMNNVGLKFIGVKAKEVETIDFMQWVHPDYQSKVKNFYSVQFKNKQKTTYLECPIVLKGKTIWLGLNASLLLETVDVEERMVGFLLILRDISKQKEQEDILNSDNAFLDKKVKKRTLALNKSNKRLINLNRELKANAEELAIQNNELEEFSFTVSHNVRGPVARLLGLTNLFNLVGIEEQQEIINQLKVETISLDSVISDLNNVLQIRNNIYNIKEFISLPKVVNNALKSVIEKREAYKLELDIEEKIIYGTTAYIQNILYNLISNAIKYKIDGVNLIIKISCKKEGKNYLLEVVDNGRGIDLDLFGKKVFKMYSRFDLKTQGKGLGLYLVKKQVEAMNGSIRITSKINKGTTFTITLPAPDDIDIIE